MLTLGLLVVLQAAGSPVVTTEPALPSARGWDDFPVFLWREKYAGGPPPEELVAPFGGVILMRQEDSGWARERGLSYLIWNVAGRDALHLDANDAWNARVERWIETHDEKLLVREPCLNDPKTIAGLHATLDATLAKHGAHPGLGFVLGDEVSLTPNGDPFDLCRCGFCEAKWKAHARENGLPERAPLTDEVLRGLRGDDFSQLGAWLARRRFDQEQMLAVMEGLIARNPTNESGSPDDPYLGLLGCTGQTAFGGLSLDVRLLERLGMIECYDTVGARELVATVPGLWRHGMFERWTDPGPSIQLTTLLVGEETPAGLAWGVFDAWMRRDSGLVLWNDARLEGLSDAARSRLTEALDTVRSLERPSPHHMRLSPRPETVAVVRDGDATAVSFLRDALLDGPTWPRRRASYQRTHGALESKVTGWLRLLEDCGLQPGVLPLSSVCSGCSAQFGVLVLPELLVLDEDDIERLAAYVRWGGWLVLDGTLGWVDRAGRPRTDADLRERIAGAHPERVLMAPESIAAYPGSRTNAQRGAPVQSFVLELAPVRRARLWREQSGLPSFSGDAGRIPWRMDMAVMGEEGARLVLLPNYTTPEQRRALLEDVPLDGIRAPEGFQLQWMQPADGRVLRAGDAAVARIVRVR